MSQRGLCNQRSSDRRRSVTRRTRRGFIILFGWRGIISNDSTAPAVNGICPQCRTHAQIAGKSHRNWFTFFFIPVFPISGKTRFSQCTNCGGQFRIPIEQFESKVSGTIDKQRADHAMALYHNLRESPNDPVILNELLEVYGNMGEYGEALSAANTFPNALHASERCMVTFGRILLAMNNCADAVKWFDAALARNINLGPAHFHKAIALLNSTPSQLDAALASARAARGAQYPDSEGLIREIESRLRQPLAG